MATEPIKQVTDRREISLDEWKAEGVEKFGEVVADWVFECPACHETQTMRDFVDAEVKNPDTVFYFSCIGRWAEGRGCDWTLGGLLQIHKTEVIAPDGDKIAVMEWGEADVGT